MTQAVKQVIIDFLRHEWGIKSWLCTLLLFIAALCFILNALFFHYSGVSYLSILALYTLPGAFFIYLIAYYIEDIAPRVTFVLRSAWTLFAISFVISVLLTAVQLTPFKSYDLFFYKLDGYLGFDIISLLNWVHSFKYVRTYSISIYNSLTFMLLAGPIFLVIFDERKALGDYFLYVLLSVLIGLMIYYFFPTTTPAAVTYSQYFSRDEIVVVERFVKLHQYLPVHGAEGGLVGFPSFHVIWTLLVTYSCKNRKIIFYPMLIWALLIILSTLTLGWHYMVDIIAAFLLVGVIIWSSNWASRKYTASINQEKRQ